MKSGVRNFLCRLGRFWMLNSDGRKPDKFTGSEPIREDHSILFFEADCLCKYYGKSSHFSHDISKNFSNERELKCTVVSARWNTAVKSFCQQCRTTTCIRLSDIHVVRSIRSGRCLVHIKYWNDSPQNYVVHSTIRCSSLAVKTTN